MTSVLLVRLSAMGDLVQGLGAVEALRQLRPDWRLTFVTQAAIAPLLDGLPGLARVVPFARRGGFYGVRQLRRALRKERYDVALDLQGNWKSAAVAWLSGANERIGMARAVRQEPWSRLLLHRTVLPSGLPHPARVAWDLVRCLVPEAPFLVPRLLATTAELAREQAALEAVGVNPRRPFRVVVVTDPRDPRALRRAIVARETHSSPWPVVHLFGPAEAELAEQPLVPAVRHAAHEPRRLIALGQIVASAAGHVLGPDQGATHVLAAAGAPCKVWFGSQDPGRTAPATATALVHAEPPTCSPCRARVCRHPAGPVCMDFAVAAARVVATQLPDVGAQASQAA